MHPNSQVECAYRALATARPVVSIRRMARKPKLQSDSLYFAREWRKARGRTLESVAADLGMSPQNLGKIERGQVDLLPENMVALADSLKIEPADLLRNPSDSLATKTVAVMGFVGAGSIATLFAEGQGPFDEVEAPANSTANTVALSIRGTSLGPAFDEGVVFYDDVRSPVTEDLHGRLCVVGLDDGRVLVKILRSAGDGSFHLFSNTMEEPLLNETVAWAARVKDVRPR